MKTYPNSHNLEKIKRSHKVEQFLADNKQTYFKQLSKETFTIFKQSPLLILILSSSLYKSFNWY